MKLESTYCLVALVYDCLHGNIFLRSYIEKENEVLLEDICKTLNITLSQFFAENDMVEMTDELKEFYDAWIALSPDKRKNILETMKMMK